MRVLQAFTLILKSMPGKVKWSADTVGVNPRFAPYTEGKLALKETLLMLQTFRHDTEQGMRTHSRHCIRAVET